NLLAPTGVLSKLNAHQVSVLTGRHFFPDVISAPFHHGLVIVFTAAAIMSFTGALVSLMRGRQYYYQEPGPAAAQAPEEASGSGGADLSRDAAARPGRGGRG
ncbi:MAG TPA: hypothetical protein VGD68_03815, partial [Streptosporangiaceae bacterium]